VKANVPFEKRFWANPGGKSIYLPLHEHLYESGTFESIAYNAGVPYIAIELGSHSGFSWMSAMQQTTHQGTIGILLLIVGFAQQLGHLTNAKVFKSILQN